ncbi:5'-nucleotidase C-terminal domain-containing protein [Ornithobacterium rhinotracheale]|uniref:5'-nucleotidase C-terminal domain-containing protein n=1 Tax=Ornithobacterium rhinotracheale TaxID=28251 RepID=UPI00129CD77A|nr:5'-nucleotidase [Ornithobacterium rhinotracheale]UOH77279.1 5'-nucleotidase C-terminal domain-containing protein [Ornithobacterium rhinotracheale]
MKNRTFSLISLASILSFTACQKQLYKQPEVAQQEINITSAYAPSPELTEIIAPYKKQLDQEMDQVLTYNPYDLRKGMNANLSNLLADQLLEAGNKIFQKKYHHDIDVALLNAGGIRRTFTPGNITVRSIFELMPFENEAVVVKLNGKDFLKMIDYLKEHRKKGHPIAGLSFSLDAPDLNIMLSNNRKFDVNKSYWVITNDYLQKGGDGMTFLTQPEEIIKINEKLRDIFIQEFKANDTLQINNNPRYLP